MRSTLPSILELIPAGGIGLDELARLANEALDRSGIVVEDGRAAADIDGRTIRFYQTLGIVPKPSYEGRRAMYDRDHLIRVVAAKQLQSEGYSLAEIQGALPTRSSDELAALLLSLEETRAESRISRSEKAVASAICEPPPSRSPHVPSVSSRGSESRGSESRGSESRGSESRGSASDVAPVPLEAFQLAPGVQVLIDPRYASDPARLAQDLFRALARSAHHSPVAAASMTKPHGGKDRGGLGQSHDLPPESIDPDHGGKR